MKVLHLPDMAGLVNPPLHCKRSERLCRLTCHTWCVCMTTPRITERAYPGLADAKPSRSRKGRKPQKLTQETREDDDMAVIAEEFAVSNEQQPKSLHGTLGDGCTEPLVLSAVTTEGAIQYPLGVPACR